MGKNSLLLNKDKTETVLFGAKKERPNVSAHLEVMSEILVEFWTRT